MANIFVLQQWKSITTEFIIDGEKKGQKTVIVIQAPLAKKKQLQIISIQN